MSATTEPRGARIGPAATRSRRRVAIAAGALIGTSLLLGGSLGPRWGLSVVDARVTAMVRSSLVWAETPARLLSWLGNASQVVLIVAILAVLLVLRGRKGEGLWLALTVLSGWLAGDIAKFVYQRQRPVDVGLIPLPTSSSYPSGHATTAAVLVTAILVLVFREVDNRGVRIAITTGLVAFSLGVGLSRISLGVHYAGDVIGGWMLGAGWALAASLLLPERTSD